MVTMHDLLTKELAFYGTYDNKVDVMLINLLYCATSKRHLRKLHDEILLPHWRLLRPELIQMEAFWEKHIKNSSKIGSPEEFLGYQMQIMNQGWPKGLCAYYKERLNENRKIYDFRKDRQAKLVQISTTRPFRGDKPDDIVWVELFENRDVSLRLFYSPDHQELMICLYVWEHLLTEHLTYHLLSLPSSFRSRPQTGFRGETVDFCFTLQAAWLEEFLDTEYVLDESLRPHLALINPELRDQFFSVLHEKLKDLKIPIKKFIIT